MSISTNISKNIYYGNGVTTQFPFSFAIQEKTQLSVYITNNNIAPADTYTPIISTNNITLLEDGTGELEFLHTDEQGKQVPLPNGYTIALVRNMPFTQLVTLITGQPFNANLIEQSLDSIVMTLQQLDEEIKRAITVQPSENINITELIANIFLASDLAKEQALNSSASAEIAKEEADRATEEKIIATQKAQEASNEADRARQEADKAYSLHIGTEYITRRKTIPFGHIYIDDGATYSRELFPNFYDTQLLTGNLPTKPIAEWELDEYGYCSYYGIDTLNQTFRVPKKPKFIGGGASQENIGTIIEAGLPNITGRISSHYKLLQNVEGCFEPTSDGSSNQLGPFTGDYNGFSGGKFNASRSNQIYGKSNTVTPMHDTGRWVVVAYNTQEEISIAQVQGLLQMYDTKANVSDVQYRCIYGTGQAPIDDTNAIEDEALGLNGVVSKNSEYLLQNPFGINTPVIISAEVYTSGMWIDTKFFNMRDSYIDSGTICVGVEGQGLHLTTGARSVFYGSDSSSLPCRVKVWYIGTNMATPERNEDYSFYIDQHGNLILSHNDFIPDFKIIDKNLIFTPTTENPTPNFYINENGNLIQGS